MNTDSEVLDSAERDPATGAIVLHLRGRAPLRLTASPAALRELKAAVMSSYASAAAVSTPYSRGGDRRASRTPPNRLSAPGE